MLRLLKGNIKEGKRFILLASNEVTGHFCRLLSTISTRLYKLSDKMFTSDLRGYRRLRPPPSQPVPQPDQSSGGDRYRQLHVCQVFKFYTHTHTHTHTHIQLNAHLSRITKDHPPACTLCGYREETVNHFLFDCPNLQSTRNEFLPQNPDQENTLFSDREQLLKTSRYFQKAIQQRAQAQD